MNTNACERSSVYVNLSSLLTLFGSFSGSRFFSKYSGLIGFDGGIDSAYENYALLEPGHTVASNKAALEMIQNTLGFFAEQTRPHIWPVFPHVSERVLDILEAEGVRRDDVFWGMSADLDRFAPSREIQERSGKIVWLSDVKEAKNWANAAWYGFDSGEPAPGRFVEFVESMIACPDIRLVAICPDAHDNSSAGMVATGMLATVGGTAGIYYVATHPDFRRCGMGMRIMEVLMQKAKELGYKTICLLATPSGRKLYHRCGFSEMDTVEIRVFDEDSFHKRTILKS